MVSGQANINPTARWMVIFRREIVPVTNIYRRRHLRNGNIFFRRMDSAQIEIGSSFVNRSLLAILVRPFDLSGLFAR